MGHFIPAKMHSRAEICRRVCQCPVQGRCAAASRVSPDVPWVRCVGQL